MSSLPTLRPTAAALTCPLCRDDLDGQDQAACPGCQTVYHSVCQLELSSCSTLGCSSFGLAPQEVLTGHQRELSCSLCFVQATISELEPCSGCGEFVHPHCASLRGCRSTGCAYNRPQRLGTARELDTSTPNPEPSHEQSSVDRFFSALALVMTLGFVFLILRYDLSQQTVLCLYGVLAVGFFVCVDLGQKLQRMNAKWP